MNHRFLTVVKLASIIGLLPVAGPAAAAVTTTGQVFPTPAALGPQDDLYVANALPGSLVINDGNVVAAKQLVVGVNLGVTGTVALSGPGTQLNLSSTFWAGVRGHAEVNLLGGSGLTSTESYIGFDSTGTGIVTVSGAQSLWRQNGNLYLGHQGDGELYITAGGKVLSRRNVLLSSDPQSMSLARVSGPGSTWHLSRAFTVGNQGGARVEVLDGGTISATSNSGLRIGAGVGATSSVWLDGSGTELNARALSLANSNNSTLEITNGALLTTNFLSAGLFDSQYNGTLDPTRGRGLITVDGAGSQLVTNDLLHIGESLQGAIHVRNGATLETDSAYLGASVFGQQPWSYAHNQGDAVVTGLGTTWNSSQGIYAGIWGNGSLTIADQAHVISGSDAFFGVTADRLDVHRGGQGALTLDNARLSARTVLVSPENLAGTGTIETAGWVLDGIGVYDEIADLPTQVHLSDDNGMSINVQLDWGASTSTVLRGASGGGIFGSGDPATRRGVFGTGYSGSGQATINNGFILESAHGMVGFGASSNGLLVVDGADTQWNTGRLTVAHRGVGELRVTNGAAVSFETLAIGEYADSNGLVIVDNASINSSLIANQTTIHVGRGGSGRVELTNGAVFGGRRAELGTFATGSGTVSVGNGATWSVSETYIGGKGRGDFIVGPGSMIRSNLYVGVNRAGSGNAQISGPGTSWLNSALVMGRGHVQISGGAQVALRNAELGVALASTPIQMGLVIRMAMTSTQTLKCPIIRRSP